MSASAGTVGRWASDAANGWNRFWFTPALPHTLALMRVLAGAMLLYTHLVWSLDLMAFIGPDSWVTAEVARKFYEDTTAVSYLWYIQSPAVLWAHHAAALVVMAMFTVGWYTRVTSVLTWIITITYCHRVPGALFGLDQVNAMLAMYLMVGPSGAAFSVDRWLARRTGRAGEPSASVSANLALRLVQIHLCVIYLFGGIGKMQGQMWWDGSAAWFSVANLEYQSLDMTWIIHWPLLVALLSNLTVWWEAFYCALVWPRLTRPLVLAMAVAVHGGIAVFLGMITFGLAMLIGNLAFVSPEWIAALAGRREPHGAGEGSNPRPQPPEPRTQAPAPRLQRRKRR